MKLYILTSSGLRSLSTQFAQTGWIASQKTAESAAVYFQQVYQYDIFIWSFPLHPQSLSRSPSPTHSLMTSSALSFLCYIQSHNPLQSCLIAQGARSTCPISLVLWVYLVASCHDKCLMPFSDGQNPNSWSIQEGGEEAGPGLVQHSRMAKTK